MKCDKGCKRLSNFMEQSTGLPGLNFVRVINLPVLLHQTKACSIALAINNSISTVEISFKLSHVKRKPVYAICEHQFSLISTFVVRCRDSIISSFYIRNIKTLASLCS